MRHGLRRLVAVCASATVLLSTPPPAHAGWSVPGSGAGTTVAAALTTPVTPTVTGAGSPLARVFTVTWRAPEPGPVPITGYRISRNSSLLGAGVVASGTCAGVTLFGMLNVTEPRPASDGSFSCTDVALLSLGTVAYTVTPIYQRWTGPPSGWSRSTS